MANDEQGVTTTTLCPLLGLRLYQDPSGITTCQLITQNLPAKYPPPLFFFIFPD